MQQQTIDNENNNNIEYAGFRVRFIATMIDGVLLLLLTIPILMQIYDDYWQSEKYVLGFWDLLLSWVLPFIGAVLFWVHRSATPGKSLMGLRVIDANTGASVSAGQAIIRYLAYFPSGLIFCLGYLWIAFHPKKQGWHDLLAKTVVVRTT